MLADAGTAYELTEARRFNQPWERGASLRLRAGDSGVIGESPPVRLTHHPRRLPTAKTLSTDHKRRTSTATS